MDTMITTYNTAVTDAASEILGKERRRKKPWVTKDVLDLCDERRDLFEKKFCENLFELTNIVCYYETKNVCGMYRNSHDVI